MKNDGNLGQVMLPIKYNKSTHVFLQPPKKCSSAYSIQ